MSEVVNSETAQDTPQADQGTIVTQGTETPKEDAPQQVVDEKKELSDKLYPDQDKSEDSEKKTEDESSEGDKEKKEETPEGQDEDESKDFDTLDLPEESYVKQARLDEIVAEAREQGLSKKEAQALVDREHKAISAYLDDEKSALGERSQGWVEDVKSDEEIGGEKFITNIEHAKRAVDKYASDSLKTMLEQTGLGNHPEVVRLFARVGKVMANDEFVDAPNGNIPPKQPKNIAERLYGNTTPN